MMQFGIMKKTVIVILIFSIVLASCLCLTACDIEITIDVSKRLEKCDQSKIMEDFADGNTLVVQADVYDVLVYGTESDKVVVSWISDEQYNVDIRYYREFSATVAGATDDNDIVIHENSKSTVTFHVSNLSMVIGIPETWKNCKLHIQTTAGAIQVEGLDFCDVALDVTAGSIHIESEVSQNVKLTATAGSIHAEVDAQSATLVATTGGVKFEGSITNELVVETTTGGISVTGKANSATISATTGSVKFSLESAKISASCTTGSVSGTVEGDKNLYTINVKVGTGSSNLSNQVGDGTHSLNVSTSTGTVNVKFK